MKKIIRQEVVVSDPPIAKFIFGDTRFAWVWLVMRLYLAYSWLTSGVGKLSNPGWMETGVSLKNFWANALKMEPRPVITFEWYRDFIQYLFDMQAWTWFAKLIVIGEVAVGFFLLLGAFTGIAAVFGGFLNWNFMMAGTASSNPLLFFFAVLLVMAWKTAGYWGADRFLLPYLGTPWRPGFSVGEAKPAPAR